MRHYKIYRDYMKHEDDLLNHRTTWLLIFQGFLFATLGVIGEWQVAEPTIFFTERNWLPFLLVGAGIFVAGFSWVGLKAADTAMERLCKDWHDFKDDYEPEDWRRIPGLAGGGDDGAKRRGKLPSLCIPWFLIATWILVGVMVLVDHFQPPGKPSGASTAIPLIR